MPSFSPVHQSDCILDISHWQGTIINFDAIRRAGIAAIFIKSSQGSGGHDPRWSFNSYAAGQAGLLFAPYHFVTTDTAQAQFDNVMRVARPGAGSVIMLDWETNPTLQTVASADLVAELGQLVEGVTGRPPVIYCGRYQLKTPHPVLSRWPLMLAQWTTRSTANCGPGWDKWLFWQYTDKARVRGITAPVDRSRYAGTTDELTAWWRGEAAPVPTPSPPPVQPKAPKQAWVSRSAPPPPAKPADDDNIADELNARELERVIRDYP